MRVITRGFPLPGSILVGLAIFVGACSGSGNMARQLEDDPSVVAIIDGQLLRIDDFEKKYAKTVGGLDEAVTDSTEDYLDFLERYVNFRVKVLAAREAGIGDDPEIVNELASYRTQYARPYLMEQAVVEPLVKQMFDRRQEMVSASHILIRVEPTASPADTASAFGRMQALVDSIEAGADFGDIAVKYSDDPSAKSARRPLGYRGDLGYFTSGRMVYQFEDQAYATPVGGLSPIFRTQYGYHILKVNDRRPMVPDVKISHIMVTPDGTAPEDTLYAMATIDTIQTKLAAGESFADLAAKYSDDRQSSERGGDLGFVTFDGRLLPAIKEAAFDLKEIDDVTDPVITPFGIHLIQLTGRKPPATYAESFEELKRLVSRMPRMDASEKAFARKTMVRLGARVDTTRLYSLVAGHSADSLMVRLSDGSLPDSVMQQPIATMGDSTYAVADVSKAHSETPYTWSATDSAFLVDIVDQFLLDQAIAYEVNQLESDDPEFSQTMDDFRDGLMLFRIMEDSVWTVSTTDTTALMELYEANRDKYRFVERVRMVSVSSPSRPVLAKADSLLSSGVPVANLKASVDSVTALRLRIDTTYVAGTTNSIYDNALSLESGKFTNILPYNPGFIIIRNDGTEPPRQKTFEEAKAEVVNEYQQILESALVERLRRKYGVRVFPDRVTAAFEDGRTDAPSEST